MMHDAFDDIPPQATFNVSLSAVCFNSACDSSNKTCSVTNVHETGSLEVSKESNVPACVASACLSHTVAIDVEPT